MSEKKDVKKIKKNGKDEISELNDLIIRNEEVIRDFEKFTEEFKSIDNKLARNRLALDNAINAFASLIGQKSDEKWINQPISQSSDLVFRSVNVENKEYDQAISRIRDREILYELYSCFSEVMSSLDMKKSYEISLNDMPSDKEYDVFRMQFKNNIEREKDKIKKEIDTLTSIATSVDIENKKRHKENETLVDDFICRYIDFVRNTVEYCRIENDNVIDDIRVQKDKAGADVVRKTIVPFEDDNSRIAWNFLDLVSKYFSSDDVKLLKSARENFNQSKREIDLFLQMSKDSPQYRSMSCLYNLANLIWENYHLLNKQRYLINKANALEPHIDKIRADNERFTKKLRKLDTKESVYDSSTAFQKPLRSVKEKKDMLQNISNNQSLS